MTVPVEISRDGAVQILRLARPEKKNAITGPMYAALVEALETRECLENVLRPVE